MFSSGWSKILMSTNVNAGALNTNAEMQAGERNRRGKVKGFFFLVDRSN